MANQRNFHNNLAFVLILLLAIAFMLPIFIVFMNSFKGRFFISDTPFALPNSQTFVGRKKYIIEGVVAGAVKG